MVVKWNQTVKEDAKYTLAKGLLIKSKEDSYNKEELVILTRRSIHISQTIDPQYPQPNTSPLFQLLLRNRFDHSHQLIVAECTTPVTRGSTHHTPNLNQIQVSNDRIHSICTRRLILTSSIQCLVIGESCWSQLNQLDELRRGDLRRMRAIHLYDSKGVIEEDRTKNNRDFGDKHWNEGNRTHIETGEILTCCFK